MAHLPLLGDILPGIPLLAGPNIKEYLAVPRSLLRGIEGCFIVRMSGDSMTGAHILGGDLVIVRPAQRAESEELVAVRIGADVTIRRYIRKGNRIDLRAQNPNYAPLPLRRGDDTAVVGTLVGLIRVC
jgi:repressor LexA